MKRSLNTDWMSNDGPPTSAPSRHRARRRFGQNFLYDQRVTDQIIDAIAPSPDEHLVEIGPGQGALTGRLAELAGRLDLIEIDYDLHAELQAHYAGQANVTVHRADILRFDLAQISTDKPLRVVGNLPYNISTPLLFHLFDSAATVTDMHFMLQREVVDRLVSEPGGGDYGRLSVMTQFRCTTTRLFDVSPHAFRPVPKVYSSVARLVPHANPPAVSEYADLKELVTRCFSQRRKTLRNCLKKVLAEPDIIACGIDPGVRPQTLSLAQFAALANAFTQSKVTHKICG